MKREYHETKLALTQKAALGVGFFCLFFIEKTSEVLAVPFYQMMLGVDPFLFSVALTLPIIISSFFSPWVGQLTDNYHSRFGRRRPFIFISAWISALLFGLMWMVPEHWATNSQLLYFFIVSMLFYIASLFYSVPLISMSYEITKDAHERIKVMEMNTYFIKLASLSGQWLYPLAALSLFGTVFFGIKVVGWGIAIVVIGLLGMLPALIIRENNGEKTDRVVNKVSSSQLCIVSLVDIQQEPSMSSWKNCTSTLSKFR
ncbi:MAG: MFS transporter [Pseudomonadales bacterium]